MSGHRIPSAIATAALAAALGLGGCYASHAPVERVPGDAGADTASPEWDAGARRDGCVPVDEVCNGVDDDCDGRVDEGAADELGCRAGEVCRGLCI